MTWNAKENHEWVLARINEEDAVLVIGDDIDHWITDLQGKVRLVEGSDIKYYTENAVPCRMYTTIILEGDVTVDLWEKARLAVGPKGVVLWSAPYTDERKIEFFRDLSGVFGWKEGTTVASAVAEGKDTPVAEDVTVLITTIPTRAERLQRAVNSVVAQTMLPAELIIQMDEDHIGAPANRDAGIARVKTKYVALLDDDDFFYADHIETLYKAALEHDADIVYSWFGMDGGTDPFPENFGKPWDPENPVQTTVTTLSKVETIKKAGGYSNTDTLTEEELETYAQGNTVGEDFRMVASANRQGAKIIHVPKRTWAYSHWWDGTQGNTSGRPDRW
ncbi:glycosyltransferase [Arthrobacter phage Racecar]|nr:glycosyltransferase [Arthrobacter phage Racecar]QFG12898.1 glycosyltransferase [Arthrobacter phage Mimi]